MNYKIVSDSSCNVFTVENCNYATVPMKVRAEKEYVDTPDLDLMGMVTDLQHYKGTSGSSCPNVQEWLDAFGDAEYIFGVTISKNLSGSYNAAQQAAQNYMEKHPDRKVFIFDSLSAGPQQFMLVENICQCIAAGDDFETVKEKVLHYHNHTHILFCLESLTNLARNGRVSMAVAKIAGVLGMRVVGDAKGGQITPIHKPRGHKKAIKALVGMLLERGLEDGGYVRIAHCFAEAQANDLKEAVLEILPNVRFIIEPTTALCSFYAEEGGLMIGFEGAFNKENNNQEF